MKKILCFLSVWHLCFFPARTQNADLGIGGIIMPFAGATSVGYTIQLKADVRNFGFDDINAGCALVTISVPSAICSITGLNSGSSPVWTIFSNSMPASVTLRNTGGPLPADFEPYYIILNVVGINAGGPLTINSHSGLNGFSGGCMANGNLDPYNDDATTSIMVSAGSPALPLHFTGFSVNEKGCSGTVSWTTADEQNVNRFEVQQSFDGITFITFRSVSSQGNGDHMYSVNADQLQKRMYYRVMAIDIDGRRSYGPIQTLQLTGCMKAETVRVFPAPAYKDQKITLQANGNDRISYRLIGIGGNVVMTGTFVRTKQISVMHAGIYKLELTSVNFRETQTIIIQ